MKYDIYIYIQEDWVLCRVFYKSRSEIPSKSQETTKLNQVTPSLPPLMEPVMGFDPNTQPGPSDNQYHEQVPCFSIFNQTDHPTFSLLTHVDPPETMHPSFSGIIPNIGNYNSPPLMNSDPDNKLIRAVLNHLTKIESGNDQISIKGGSPSFGEGSSDSYLSEVGLSSMWNHYLWWHGILVRYKKSTSSLCTYILRMYNCLAGLAIYMYVLGNLYWLEFYDRSFVVYILIIDMYVLMWLFSLAIYELLICMYLCLIFKKIMKYVNLLYWY